MIFMDPGFLYGLIGSAINLRQDEKINIKHSDKKHASRKFPR